MTNLYIDGRQAVLPTDTQIKVTAENPLFTDAGTYTLEVALPLEGCADNQRIFGPIHRADVLKAELTAKRWPFVLVAPPLHIEGTARVSSVDNEGVKIQLLAGRSALNDASKNADGEDLYIDELHNIITKGERGFPAIGGWEASSKRHIVRRTPTPTLFLLRRPRHVAPRRAYAPRTRRRRGDRGDSHLFHRRQGDGQRASRGLLGTAGQIHRSRQRSESLRDDKRRPTHRAFPRRRKLCRRQPTRAHAERHRLCPAALLVVVVERLLKALGFDISPEDNASQGTWQERIIVANCRKTVHIAHMLPHWTVKEFIREVQNFFGVLITTEGRRARIVRKRNAYGDGAKTHLITQPLDEYTATVEENAERKDTAGANVAYKLPRSTSECSCPRTWSRS